MRYSFLWYHCESGIAIFALHYDLKVASSQAKIDENFAIYFVRNEANIKCFKVLKCTCKGLQKSIRELER